MNEYINFNGLYKIKPKNYFIPETLSELQNIIKENKKIRIFGGKHAFNDIDLCSDTMINMKKLNKILRIKDNTVKVEAGIKLHSLLDQLEEYNLTLPSVTATSYVSIGGVIGTGAHGSNLTHGSMSNMVLEAELVDHKGDLIKITDEQTLKAVRCNLGCLGAIYSLTLQCEKMFYIEEKQLTTTWKLFYKNIDKLLHKFPYTDLYVDQFNDNLKTDVTLMRKTNKHINNANTLTKKFTEYYIEIELAFPLEKINDAVLSIVEFHKNQSIKSKSGIYIRFCDKDDTYLSMASDRKTTYISSFFGHEVTKEQAEKFMKQLSDEMINKYNARPHYGKIHNLNSKQMKKIYGKNYDLFESIKQKFDPNNKFSNEYINKLFL
jgi:L-gulonolactone oxidase